MIKEIEQYTYQQALTVIETFLKDTDIRNFCTNYCVGNCCIGCYKSKNACHKNEGRRISCSIFVCNALRNLIFTPKIHEIYYKVSDAICYRIRNLKRGCEFYTPDTKIINKFRINKNIVNKLKTKDTQFVYAKVKSLEHVISSSRKFNFAKYPHIEV